MENSILMPLSFMADINYKIVILLTKLIRLCPVSAQFDLRLSGSR